MPRCPYCQKDITASVTFHTGAPAPQTSNFAATATDLGELLAMIDVTHLDGIAADFVMDTRKRFARYAERTKVSGKQFAWLRKLAGAAAGSEPF